MHSYLFIMFCSKVFALEKLSSLALNVDFLSCFGIRMILKLDIAKHHVAVALPHNICGDTNFKASEIRRYDFDTNLFRKWWMDWGFWYKYSSSFFFASGGMEALSSRWQWKRVSSSYLIPMTDFLCLVNICVLSWSLLRCI